MENVPERRDRMSLTEIRRMQVAGNKRISVGETVTSGNFLCNRDDLGPIDSGHAYLRGLLSNCNAPNTRACGQIQDRNRRRLRLHPERSSQSLGARVVDRKYVFDEPQEKA